MRGRFLASASLATIAIGLASTGAKAQDHYLSLFGGVVLPENSGFIYGGYMYDVRNNTGFTLGAAIGSFFTPTLRAELELSYIRYAGRDYTYYGGQGTPGETSGNQNLYFLMGNIWSELPAGGRSPPMPASVSA